MTDKFSFLADRSRHSRSLIASLLALLFLISGAWINIARADDGEVSEPVQDSEQAQPPKTLRVLKGGVQYLVPKGTNFKLKLATVPTNGMRLLDRDLDGNLYPAKIGQQITAKTSEDLYVDDHNVIPEGTVFHGKVSQIAPPRRLKRTGWLQIKFDQFTTPDGPHFHLRSTSR